MVRKLMGAFGKYKIWFFSILILNFIFGAMLWLIDTERFLAIFPTMLLASFMLYCAIGLIVYFFDEKKKEHFMDFLDNPDIEKQKKILSLFSLEEKEVIKEVGEILRNKNSVIKSQEKSIDEYEEYIESWAHEIKTPLALMTFVLDNRKEEISPIVYKRLEYSRTKIQEDIERMLYYARLKSASSDYFFKELSLKEICDEVVEEYDILLKEENISTVMEIENSQVISDKKALLFLIRQIISNSIKYKKANEESHFIIFSAEQDEISGDIKLIIRDNGIGIKAYDLPYIFEKGFTGEIGEQRKNSTGMGLYLVKQLAHNLKIELQVSENYKEGFEISLVFPKI
ncbi:Signal transduction histidine kinase [Clostridium collagenovorans DSM 3089]|uniref:histidine kinase n=1 Tax=Clostridium collagenovorans DSM 3089 TaxID=1121306 RepID=A0A1M5V0U0_9CLOT|nr:sensor histidine kinase [Clostridium collagenovorans]SHH68882.1 Signal transduction histidine kinase [Clostridium collagenovorans DSM 3089]